MSEGPAPVPGGLRVVRRRDHFGAPRLEVETGPECNNCGRPLDVAHAAFETVAMLMGERLRQALSDHLDDHGCGKLGGAGFASCGEAVRLFGMLPDGDRILIG